jgi:hypothetical protein
MRLSFGAKLWLLFGTDRLLVACFAPLLTVPPLTGLEYAFETETATFKRFNLLQLSDAADQ